MTIANRITTISNMNNFLVIRKTVEKLRPDCFIVTLDYWLKRSQGNNKRAELRTERYIVENYNTEDEEAWLDNIPIGGGMRRSKSW